MSGATTAKSSNPSSHQSQASISQQIPAPIPVSKPASPATTVQEPKLNYAQAAGKATSSSGTSSPASQVPPATTSSTTTPTVQQGSTSTPIPSSTAQPNVSMNPSYANGSARPAMPPTGPAALNGSMSPQHSRTSSTASNYRVAPPQAAHNSKPSMTGQPPYNSFPTQSPRPPVNGGRNSPFVDNHDDDRANHRSPPPQSRNGSVAGISMARHSSTSSQSDRQVPPSPRPAARANAAGYPYPYQNAPAYAPYNQGMGRGQYRNPSGSVPFQPGMQQFQRGQPPRSPHQQNIPLAPQMYGMQPHMPVQPIPQPGQYVNPPFPPFSPAQYMDLTRGDMQYIPTTDQFGQQMQMPGPYMMQQQFHPQQQQQHAFNPNAPPHQHQMFSPPPQNMPAPFTPAQSRSPMNQPMSRSASVASEINTHSQPPATPSPAPKEESSSTFIKPKKSSAIKIVNPDTKTEITFPKVTAAKAPERSPSPAVKAASAKAIPRATHSPAPSLDVDRPSSGMGHKSKEEIAEEMKAKVQKTLEEAKRKEAEKEEAERIEREKKIEEERKAKEEADRLEKERKEAEERAEQERIQREKEETERKAEEERIAAQNAKEEEEARIAKEKAEEEAALEAARLAKERAAAEEQEAKAKEEAELAAATPAAEDTPPSEERRPSLGGARKTAPPPLALKSDVSVSDGLQSAALKTAAFIKQDAFLTTKYPDGFKSPDPAINAKFGNKGFHYNVEFLYQFKDIYKDKPTEDWDVKIKETMGDMDTRNQRSMGGAGRAVSTSGPMFQMGSFGKSSPITRHPSGIPPLATGGLPFGGMGSNFQPRIPPRSISSGQGMQAPSSPSGRTQSKSQRQSSRRAPQPPPPPPEPPVEPLPVNPNRWKPQRAESSLGPPLGAEAVKLTPEVVQRKVKSLLNKLTLEKFDKITDQILEIASQSRTETDGRTLRQIIQLTFEKATDEPNFSEMYALFCRKIMETIDPNITDPAVLNKDGQPLTGGQLFRKYLLNRCQEEFERGWKVNLPPKPDENAVGKEAELLSDAYYVAAKAKRQGLGLVKFIGELFKLNMLIEKIMYECIIKLLGKPDDPHPEPEEMESLCRLLNTVGKALDEGKAKTRMNAIYEAFDHIRIHSDLESRIKFKMLDVLDLRKSGWVGRATGPTGPKTIQEIHDDAAKAKLDAEIARQNAPARPRQEFGRGDARVDGWNSAPRPNKVDNRVGDMSKLGMVRTSSAGGLGPQMSQFNSMRNLSSRKGNAGGNSLQREGSGQSSRTATPGVATPPSVTSTNSFDIFRNESETKDDESMPAPSRIQRVVAPDDEVAEGGYYTIPPIQKAANTASLSNFVVARKGYGTISFSAPVDLTGISSLSILREIVEIERGRVAVYPNSAKEAPAGTGLNVPAEVSLENVRPPPEIEVDEFTAELRGKPDTTFVSYNAETGLYVFTVEHFSCVDVGESYRAD